MRATRIMGPRGLRLQALVPETRRERARGLLGRASLATDEALLLEHARSIHTFGMRFTITAALIDDGLVQRVLSIPPNRLLLPRSGVRHILECHVDIDLRRGDHLDLDRGSA
jgi:uncharacterized protein